MDTMLLLNITRDLYIHKINRITIIIWKKMYIYIYDVQNLFLGSTWRIWKVNESLQSSSNMVQSTVLLRPHQVTFLNLMLLLEFWKRALSAVKVLLSGIFPPLPSEKRKEKRVKAYGEWFLRTSSHLIRLLCTRQILWLQITFKLSFPSLPNCKFEHFYCKHSKLICNLHKCIIFCWK